MERNHPSSPPVVRWHSLDALRGLAVLLMITQHVAYWMVARGAGNDWVVLFTGALGGLAAPIFVSLSGLGVTFLCRRREGCDRRLMIRGAMVIGFGYLMNFLTPHWFSMGSWYVLHLIGFAMMVSPLLRRLPDTGLLAVAALVLAVTVLTQNYLDTPFRLFNNDMAVPMKPGGILRFALAEGFFPIFPWLAFFIAGIVSGRWILAENQQKVWRLAVGLIVTMLLLTGVHALGLNFTRHPHWVRLFYLKTTFYPALTPITLFLIGVSLLFIYAFVRMGERIHLRASDYLVCLGRVSLTLLVVHVAVVREGAYFFGIWKRFPAPITLAIVLGLLGLFSLAAVKWQKINFKFGAEWLLRKVAG